MARPRGCAACSTRRPCRKPVSTTPCAASRPRTRPDSSSVRRIGKIRQPGPGMRSVDSCRSRSSVMLTVLDTDEVTLVRRGWPTSLFGVLAVVRGWGQRTLTRDFVVQHDVASALLLGEGADMSGADWERYQRTGVIHVLAISGQHLAVLAGFLWLATWALGIRRRSAALAIALFLISY